MLGSVVRYAYLVFCGSVFISVVFWKVMMKFILFHVPDFVCGDALCSTAGDATEPYE